MIIEFIFIYGCAAQEVSIPEVTEIVQQEITEPLEEDKKQIDDTQGGKYAVIDARTLELLDSARRMVVIVSASGGGWRYRIFHKSKRIFGD